MRACAAASRVGPLYGATPEIASALVGALGQPPTTARIAAEPTLDVVETSQLQRAGIPGIIALDRPAQADAGFDALRTEFLARFFNKLAIGLRM